MLITCPNCTALVEQERPPARNDPTAGEAWVCFRCPGVVCVNCYIKHNEVTHPAVYGLQSKPTVGGKKRRKKK